MWLWVSSHCSSPLPSVYAGVEFCCFCSARCFGGLQASNSMSLRSPLSQAAASSESKNVMGALCAAPSGPV